MSRFILFSLLSLILTVCPLPSLSSNLYQYHQVSMGTVVEITLLAKEEIQAQRAALQAFQEIKRVEALMSPWNESSDVSRINRFAGKEGVAVSLETLRVIQGAQEISELSGGAFDITTAPLTHLWRKAREKKVPPSFYEVKKVLPLVNFRNIGVSSDGKVFLRKKGMSIDLGGIAKGFAVDRAFDLLKSLGYENFIVNAGGDLKAGGLKNNQLWSIGIQDPRDSQKIMGIFSVSDRAMATSGDYEKFFLHQGRRYHHLLNPIDGFPTEGCQSVTILCKEGMMADGLATAVFILGPEKGYTLCQRLGDTECLIVDKEGKNFFTPNLRNRFSFNP